MNAVCENVDVGAVNRSLRVHGEAIDRLETPFPVNADAMVGLMQDVLGGIDGDLVTGTIVYSDQYHNAFFNGEQMFFGPSEEDVAREEEEAAINRSLRIHGEAVDLLDEDAAQDAAEADHFAFQATVAALNRSLRVHGEALNEGAADLL